MDKINDLYSGFEREAIETKCRYHKLISYVNTAAVCLFF